MAHSPSTCCTVIQAAYTVLHCTCGSTTTVCIKHPVVTAAVRWLLHNAALSGLLLRTCLHDHDRVDHDSLVYWTNEGLGGLRSMLRGQGAAGFGCTRCQGSAELQQQARTHCDEHNGFATCSYHRLSEHDARHSTLTRYKSA